MRNKRIIKVSKGACTIQVLSPEIGGFRMIMSADNADISRKKNHGSLLDLGKTA